MRNIVIILLGISSFNLFAQNLDKIMISPVVGFKTQSFSQEGLSTATNQKWLTTSVIGIELGIQQLPLSLSYQREYNIQLYDGIPPDRADPIAIDHSWEEEHIHLYFRGKRFNYGVGHYWKKRENILHHLYPDVFLLKRRGFQASFGYSLNWLDIELRSQFQYDPDFAGIVGIENYSIYFVHRIKTKKIEHKKINSFVSVNGIIGVRMFPIDLELYPGEEFVKKIGFAPSLGLEFMVNKYNLSLNVEKDWWIYLNGGSFRRDIRGLVFNTNIGAKYHLTLANNKKLRLGAGVIWIEDSEKKLDNVTLNPTPEQQKLVNFQVKGISIATSYEILKNVDIEVRSVIPWIGEDIFESASRSSIGILYRINPYN